MIYLDGSALCRFLPGVRHGEVWETWVASHKGELVTSRLGLTELRQAAALYPRESVDEITEIIEQVRTKVPVTRFSDDKVSISSHANAVLKPFAALHIGAAVGDERVDTIATYDPALAHVAEIYRLKVVTPGLDERWYLEFEGPVESWSPVDLDAPYADRMGKLTPRQGLTDPFEEALKDVVSVPSQPMSRSEGALDDLAQEGGIEDADISVADQTSDGTPILAASEVNEDEGDKAASPDSKGHEPADLPGPMEPVSGLTQPVSASPTPPEAPAEKPLPSVSPPPPLPPSQVDGPGEESEASRRREEMIAALGVYKPKVVVREGSDADEVEPRPDVGKTIPEESEPLVVRPSSVSGIEQPPAPPTPPQPVETEGKEPSQRPPLIPVSGGVDVTTPVEPLTYDEDSIAAPELPPIQVKFEEPVSYAPARYDPTGARPLPDSHPFARTGSTAAMEAPPIPPQEVPKLEPAPPDEPQAPAKPIGRKAPPPDQEAPDLEKEAEGERALRKRRGKEGKKRHKEAEPSELPASPQTEQEEDLGWKLEDIIGHGIKKGKRKPS